MADTTWLASTTAKASAGTLDGNEEIRVIDDPAGTPASKKTTPSAIRTYILGLAADWLANGAASTPALDLSGTWFTGGTATTTKPQFLIEPAGTTSTGWSTSGTGIGVNAATGFVGNLLDLQVNSSSRFSVNNTNAYFNAGNPGGTYLLSFGNSSAYPTLGSTSSGSIYLGSGNGGYFTVNTSNGNFTSNGALQLNATGAPSTIGDVILARDAANTLALRNGTNAQTFRAYGTYTDASNHRRVALSMTTAGVATLAAEGAGTGASGNVLHISSLPTSNPGPGILWNNAGTPAIGT